MRCHQHAVLAAFHKPSVETCNTSVPIVGIKYFACRWMLFAIILSYGGVIVRMREVHFPFYAAPSWRGYRSFPLLVVVFHLEIEVEIKRPESVV